MVEEGREGEEGEGRGPNILFIRHWRFSVSIII
jgi:hypothetical protein